MLPEVISGSIALTNVVSPIRRLCPHTNLMMREVEDIDLKNQAVTISPGFRPRQLQLPYDHLVIALSNVTNFHGMPGMIENAMPFRTLADAMVLSNHLIHVLEEADVEDNPLELMGSVENYGQLPLNCPDPTFARPLPNHGSRPKAVVPRALSILALLPQPGPHHGREDRSSRVVEGGRRMRLSSPKRFDFSGPSQW
jgi:hypothetical protein